MAIRPVRRADDRVRINTILVSLFDKTGLPELIPMLRAQCPGLKILSTGGTAANIREILGDDANRYVTDVSEYTGQPETEGGLVKTLDFKIYLGLLTESHNESHAADLKRTGATPIDLVACNLYPFSGAVSTAGGDVETARGHIDIGGPTMIRAAAKNFLRVAVVVDPGDYADLGEHLKKNDGHTTLAYRYRMARKAFRITAAYDRAIADYLREQSGDAVRKQYDTGGEHG